jgi:hypothetical protein
VIITRAGSNKAKIIILKYVFIVTVSLDAFWIVNPKIKDVVPTKKDTTVRRFCVIPVTSGGLDFS